MTERLDYARQSPDLVKAYLAFSMALGKGAIEQSIRDLVNIRVSQLNGYAFCLDMHSKEAKMHGERELRLYHVAIWRESTLFSARERACLAWASMPVRMRPTVWRSPRLRRSSPMTGPDTSSSSTRPRAAIPPACCSSPTGRGGRKWV